MNESIDERTGMHSSNRFLRLLTAVWLVSGGSVVAAAESGSLRDPWPLTDVFDTPPPRAHAKAGTACEIAERYVELVNARRTGEVGTLFAKDAVFLDPSGKLVQGREAIGAWYARDAGRNAVIPLAFHAVDRECFMEAASHLDADPDPRFRLLVIDHFTLNGQGAIARAVYYFRPGSMEAALRLHAQPRNSVP